jgi:integrase
MATEGSICHKQDQKEAQNVTASLPDELSTQASALGIQHAFEIICETLNVETYQTGITRKRRDPIGIQALANLGYVTTDIDSKHILTEWDDEEWSADLLTFNEALKLTSLNLDARYSIQNQKKFLKESALVNQLLQEFPANDPHDLKYFKAQIRLWILIQALIRSENYQCFHDRNILTAAYYISRITQGETDGWGVINRLYQRVYSYLSGCENSFSTFTAALSLAANYETDSKKQPTFLKAVQAIARGEVNPAKEHYGYNWISNHNPLLVQSSSRSKEKTGSLPSTSQQLSDEWDQLVIVTDPDATYQEQEISAKSYIRTTCEQAHILPFGTNKAPFYEVEHLQTWIQGNLVSNDEKEKVGAALVLLALLTSSSLAQVVILHIDEQAEKGWCIDNDFKYLTRKSPRRRNSWSPDDEESFWVHPYDENIQLSLHPAFNKILKPIEKRALKKNQLGTLWFSISPDQSLESWFTQCMNNESSRLRSGMLPGISIQELFNHTGQFAFTRLMFSQPHSVLPSNCSYISATCHQTHEIWEQTFLSQYAKVVSSNPMNQVIGSRLVLLENLIKKEIESAISKLESLRNGNPIHFHNAFVAYCLMMLFAATGCRPTKDPFESIRDFNWDFTLVCIDDKSDGEYHNTRLVPLAEKVIQQIKGAYLPHLKCLSQALSKQSEELAEYIDFLGCTEKASPLPLFFFLTESGKVEHVQPSSSSFQELFSWQLPPNLFRHNFIQKLLSYGVDNEVVEGWCGHIEQGVSSYGDLSARCWQEDAKQYRTSIQNLLFSLGFKAIQGWTSPPTLLFRDKEDVSEIGNFTQCFGREARRRDRDKKIQKAKHETDVIIENFTSGIGSKELSNDQIAELADKTIYSGRRKQNLKHLAPQRLNHLISWLKSTQGDEENFSWKLKKRVDRFDITRSPISTETPQALNIFKRLQDCVSSTLDKTYPSQIGATSALHLSAVTLCVNYRISYARLLQDVSKGENFRLVRYMGQCFLEYSEALEIENLHCPVQRIAIQPKLAALLDKGLSIQNNYTKRTQAKPQLLFPFHNLLDIGIDEPFEKLIQRICNIIDQVNSVIFPGHMTGALSGRIPCTSLSLDDWIRNQHDQRIDFTSCDVFSFSKQHPSRLQDTEVNFDHLLLQVEGKETQLHSRNIAQEAARKYTAEIKEIISEYTTSNSKRTATRIREAHLTSDSTPSTTVLALGDWIADRIQKGKRNNKPLEPQSVKNYYSTLATAFQGLGYQIDIHTLDPDELTEFYQELLDFRAAKHNDSIEYFEDRLVEFHHFASTKYHLPSPYWDELEIVESGRSVNAGYISEDEYLRALQQLKASTVFGNQIERDFACFITILGFRYGLRRKEALLLRRKDIRQVENQFYIHVQGYYGHKLKSKSSKRILPQLELLTRVEEEIINAILDQYHIHMGQDSSKGLIRILKADDLSAACIKLPAQIISLLKNITGNPTMVFHHLRHSYLNRVSAAAFEIDSVFSAHLYGTNQSTALRKMILGPISEKSRRLPMAIARLMGHYSPKTSFRSYNHIITDLIDNTLGPFDRTNQKFSNTIELDKCKPIGTNSPIPLEAQRIQFTQINLSTMLELMYYVGQGATAARSVQLLNLPPKVVEPFETVIQKASQMLWFKLYEQGRVKGDKAPQLLLTRIYSTAWKRIQCHSFLKEFDNNGDYPNLTRLPLLVGQSRQIILQKKSDFKLLKLVLDAFDIKPEDYKLLARGNNAQHRELAEEFGFEITEAYPDNSPKPLLIDNLRDSQICYEREYLAMELKKGIEGPLRNRSDFVVAFLAAGLAINLHKT